MNDENFVIEGGKVLTGEISVFGSKNAILPALASSIIFSNKIAFHNVPDIIDVSSMISLLNDLGVNSEIKNSKNKMSILLDSSKIKHSVLDKDVSKKMRASIILSGPLLARTGFVSFPHPGGCVIGERPIDLFLENFKLMGADLIQKGDIYELKAEQGLSGAKIFFDVQSVTATETFMMAGVLAKGKTFLKNCAVEPEVISLARFLKENGAKIYGEGSPNITIEGGSMLKSSFDFQNPSDRIEAGSFLILGALAGERLKINEVPVDDLDSVINMLKKTGAKIEIGENHVIVGRSNKILPVNIKTHEYPGFPTDLQAPMSVYLTQAHGASLVYETIFEGRLNYVQDLLKMGANIKVWNSREMAVYGRTALHSASVEGPDLRAGLAFVFAAIIAEGVSTIKNVRFIDRGYSKLEERLKDIGVRITRVKS